jgi:hypothetical protein
LPSPPFFTLYVFLPPPFFALSVVQAAVTQLLRGQQLLLRNRPDAAAFADQEQQQVDAVRQVMARCGGVCGAPVCVFW